jgi:3D (Asp-Asp-Asp) domain-containing protein
MEKMFTKFNCRDIFNTVLIFVVMSCLVASNNYPHVVKAESLYTAMIDLSVFVSQKTNTIPQKFPESKDREPVKTVWVVVTAYSSTVDQTDNTPCHTANDFDLCTYYETFGDYNTIAGNGMSFGTEVRLPDVFGDKVFIVRDRMNKRYTYGRIDVWLPTREEAVKFGVKRVKMEIYN